MLQSKYNIDIENMTEAEKQKIIGEIEGDDFISGIEFNTQDGNEHGQFMQ